MPQVQLPYTPNTLQDGRRKILKSEYPLIKQTYKETKSQRETARIWKVSRRLIQFILDPNKLKQFQKIRYAKKPWLDYYNTEKNTLYMRRFRAKKRKAGLMINPTTKKPSKPKIK